MFAIEAAIFQLGEVGVGDMSVRVLATGWRSGLRGNVGSYWRPIGDLAMPACQRGDTSEEGADRRRAGRSARSLRRIARQFAADRARWASSPEWRCRAVCRRDRPPERTRWDR